MSSVVEQLLAEILENYKKKLQIVDSIKIHPEYYWKLVASDKYLRNIHLKADGTVTWRGTPLEITDSVDKWEIKYEGL